MLRSLVTFLCVLLVASAGRGQEITDLEVRGLTVRAEISVPGQRLELTLGFEQAVGLGESGLGLTARRASAESVRSRLPRGALFRGLPAVILEFHPPPESALSWSGAYVLELRARRAFAEGSGWRLFRAVPGGPFEDATEAMGGSLRIRARGAGAAEWLLLEDPRSPAEVAGLKLGRLEALLEEHAGRIPDAVYRELWSRVGTARAAWERADTRSAASEIDAFRGRVAAAAGRELPDVWRSYGDLRNVAAELDSTARTLRFSWILSSESRNQPTF